MLSINHSDRMLRSLKLLYLPEMREAMETWETFLQTVRRRMLKGGLP